MAYIDLKNETPENIKLIYSFLIEKGFNISDLTKLYMQDGRRYSDGLLIDGKDASMSPKPSDIYIFKSISITDFINSFKTQLLTGKTRKDFFDYFLGTDNWTERDVLVNFETKTETERLALIVNWLYKINIYICPEYAGENKFRPLVTYKNELEQFRLQNTRNKALIKSIEYINTKLNENS